MKYERLTIRNNNFIDTNCKNCKQCKKVEKEVEAYTTSGLMRHEYTRANYKADEEKMLKCIKLYCGQGAETINKLEERIEFLQEQLERYRQREQSRTNWGILK